MTTPEAGKDTVMGRKICWPVCSSGGRIPEPSPNNIFLLDGRPVSLPEEIGKPPENIYYSLWKPVLTSDTS